ncbi:MAG: radical SAM peptide maturase [Prevotellaceae bacterium]|jgi:uncharacterized protein|nr:radical SAM peptide maturase [Prevotellaceae bacterium]
MQPEYIEYLSGKDIMFQLSNLKQLTFEATDACNLQCMYCGYGEFYEEYDNREDNYFPVDKALLLIDYLTELWNSPQNISSKRNLTISFYGGEPLLNMPFIKTIIDYILNKDCRNRTFSFSMTTNALLLHKYMDYLVDKNFKLLISLDGNEGHTSYRVDKKGNSSYSRIIRGVDLLREKYPVFFDANVNFNAVLHNRNNVQEVYNYFKEKYNKTPRIAELSTSGIKAEMKDKFIKTYRNSYESLRQAENYEEIEREMYLDSGSFKSAVFYLLHYSGYVYSDYNDLLYDKCSDIKLPTGTCIPFSKRMFVTVNGKILPCERIGHQYSLGQITVNTIELNPDKIAHMFNHHLSKIAKQCNKCFNACACVQCIYHLRNLESRPVCYGFMNEIDFKKYEENQLKFLEKNPDAYYHIMKDMVVEL